MELSDKKTVVLITSPKTDRYSNRAVHMLIDNDVPVIPIGYKAGEVNGVHIIPGQPDIINLHTLSLYLNPKNQEFFYNYILELKPQRVIFNPGTENTILQELLDANNIFWEEACTLVLLSTGQF
jgi:predicted CoA-binding protein